MLPTEDARHCLKGIAKTIAGWLKDESLSSRSVPELRDQLVRFEYLLRGHVGWVLPPPQPAINPICSEPGCKASWQAGLQNYAAAGFDPVWYCRQHQKPVVHIDPETGATHQHFVPGSPEKPPEVRLQLATEMHGKWRVYLTRLHEEKHAVVDREV